MLEAASSTRVHSLNAQRLVTIEPGTLLIILRGFELIAIFEMTCITNRGDIVIIYMHKESLHLKTTDRQSGFRLVDVEGFT